MKVKIIRASGNPVRQEKADEYRDAWQKGFDSIVEEKGKFGPETSEALDALDRKLSEEYKDLTVETVELPKTGKAWKQLLNEYGAVMVATSMEDGEHSKSGDLLLVVNDMMF